MFQYIAKLDASFEQTKLNGKMLTSRLQQRPTKFSNICLMASEQKVVETSQSATCELSYSPGLEHHLPVSNPRNRPQVQILLVCESYIGKSEVDADPFPS